MSDDLRERLTARFGRAGLRRMDPADVAVPAAQAALLTECGVPRQVGPYFTSPGDDPVRFGAYRELSGMPAAGEEADDEKASWCRVGWDRGAQLCVDAAGAVRAEFAGFDEPGALVNRTLEAFLESLLALDEALSSLTMARGAEEGVLHVRTLAQRLGAAEAEVLEARDSWWSRVLQDIRHTVSHSSYAAFEFTDARGEKQIVTEPGGLCLHPEERAWAGLQASQVAPGQVRRVHTELEPCFLPGHYCSLWMAEEFPQAEFTHTFDYGETAESREAGFLELLRHAATQRQQ